MFHLIKIIYLGFLTAIVNHTKCLSSIDHKCSTRTDILSLHSNKHTQGLRCYPFVVNWERSNGSCNALNSLIKYVFQTKQKI